MITDARSSHCPYVQRRRDENVDLDAKFAPNLLNSAIFLLSTSQQVSTFAVNFIGRPFREDISENAALKYGLLGASGVAVAGAIDFMPEFNKWLQIVEMDVSRSCSVGATQSRSVIN